MRRLFAAYPIETLARISGYNAEHLLKVKRGYRPLSGQLRRKLEASLLAHGYNTDGMFDELPELQEVAS